jgi:hypothetical protein
MGHWNPRTSRWTRPTHRTLWWTLHGTLRWLLSSKLPKQCSLDTCHLTHRTLRCTLHRTLRWVVHWQSREPNSSVSLSCTHRTLRWPLTVPYDEHSTTSTESSTPRVAILYFTVSYGGPHRTLRWPPSCPTVSTPWLAREQMNFGLRLHLQLVVGLHLYTQEQSSQDLLWVKHS